MVIDKMTGKGCAWSIVSKTVTKKLVADGIVDQPIYRKLRYNSKNRYSLLWVTAYGKSDIYITTLRHEELAEAPLWVPSFIDAGIWAQAVSRFRNNWSLDTNVERYLLPEMEGYLQSISDEELLSITRDFLVEHGVINRPISQRAEKTYFFNENEVYSLDRESKVFDKDQIKFIMFDVRDESCFNMNVWRKAVSQFAVGMTLNECIKIFLKTEIARHVPQKVTPVDRLVQYIAPARYERVPGNNNELTFDRIRITVGLPRYQFRLWETLRDEVQKYRHEIYQRVVQKLETERQFKKYGVPINFLKLSEVILLRDYSMEFIFELKDQKIDRQVADLSVSPDETGDDED